MLANILPSYPFLNNTHATPKPMTIIPLFDDHRTPIVSFGDPRTHTRRTKTTVWQSFYHFMTRELPLYIIRKSQSTRHKKQNKKPPKNPNNYSWLVCLRKLCFNCITASSFCTDPQNPLKVHICAVANLRFWTGLQIYLFFVATNICSCNCGVVVRTGQGRVCVQHWSAQLPAAVPILPAICPDLFTPFPRT